MLMQILYQCKWLLQSEYFFIPLAFLYILQEMVSVAVQSVQDLENVVKEPNKNGINGTLHNNGTDPYKHFVSVSEPSRFSPSFLSFLKSSVSLPALASLSCPRMTFLSPTNCDSSVSLPIGACLLSVLLNLLLCASNFSSRSRSYSATFPVSALFSLRIALLPILI